MDDINTTLKKPSDFACKIIKEQLSLEDICCTPFQDEEFKISICWKLKNDESRPSKPSKVIIISFNLEVLSTYQELSRSAKNDANGRIKAFLKNKIRCFNPSNNSHSPYQSPPSEEWEITQNILLGVGLK